MKPVRLVSHCANCNKYSGFKLFCDKCQSIRTACYTEGQASGWSFERVREEIAERLEEACG